MRNLFAALIMLLFTSCNSYGVNKGVRNAKNADSSISEDCLVCKYKKDGKYVSQKICGDDQAEKDEMRSTMQAAADALGVELICEGK